jgi:hypothetical protein
MARKKIDIDLQELAHLAQFQIIAQLAHHYSCSGVTIRKRLKIIEAQKEHIMSDQKPGVGLDIGTMNIVSARHQDAQVETKRVRDAFLDLELDAERMLQLGDVTFVRYEDRIIILGDMAVQAANLFKREARRPLSQGLISSSEIDALEMLSILIKQVVGEPREEGEVCYYSIPAAPLDVPGQDVTYHEAVFAQILEELGYEPISGNEAMAIIYSECAAETFSGIGISFGSGMVNCALAYQTMPIMEFSLARGGDWIDQNAARAMGTTASRMCTIKEKGIDLLNPENREQEALVVYYKALIKYALDKISKQFKATQSDTELDKAIPIVVSGGTSLPKGFLTLFKQVFDKQRKFPIEVSEIRAAEDPMTSVAEGLLVQAQQEYL